MTLRTLVVCDPAFGRAFKNPKRVGVSPLCSAAHRDLGPVGRYGWIQYSAHLGSDRLENLSGPIHPGQLPWRLGLASPASTPLFSFAERSPGRSPAHRG